MRITGQDVERGTFSHRHAVCHDQKTGERFTPLAHVFSGQVRPVVGAHGPGAGPQGSGW